MFPDLPAFQANCVGTVIPEHSQQGPREDVHSKTDACLQRGPTYFWGPSIHDAVFQLISLCVAMFIGTGMQ